MPDRRTRKLRGELTPRLTRREREVLYWIRVSGGTFTAREIAARLGAKRTTVRFYVRNILAKCNIHSKGELL